MITERDKVIILFAALTLILSSPAVYAYREDSPSPHGKTSGKTWEARQQELYKDLNVTGEQKKLLEENKNKHKEETKVMFDNLKEKRTAMRAELQKESLDMAKINQLNDELKRMETVMLDRRLERILEVRKILTPEQFKRFLDRTERQKGHPKNK